MSNEFFGNDHPAFLGDDISDLYVGQFVPDGVLGVPASPVLTDAQINALPNNSARLKAMSQPQLITASQQKGSFANLANLELAARATIAAKYIVISAKEAASLASTNASDSSIAAAKSAFVGISTTNNAANTAYNSVNPVTINPPAAGASGGFMGMSSTTLLIGGAAIAGVLVLLISTKKKKIK
jgi:hypothetical protein